MPPGLGLPIGVHDGAILLPHHFVQPEPRGRIDRLPNRADQL